MKTHFAPAVKLTIVTLFFFGVLYPLVITGIASVTAPNGGKGAILIQDGKVVGFDIIGQKFESPIYFHGRPSAVDYNAAATGGSNKGPSNPDYLKTVEERVASVRELDPEVNAVPVDLVTASGGGLDPHISPMAAMVQVRRIARARSIPEESVLRIVKENTEGPLLDVFGPSRVNVLRLNLALDKMKLSNN